MALNISSDLVPQVINDYNAYTEDDLLIGLADEITLPKIKNKTTSVSGMGIAGEVDSPVPGQFESMEATLNWNTMYSYATKMIKAQKEENKAIKNGLLAILHDRLYLACTHYIEKGYIDLPGLKNIEYLYKSYHALGGNGTGTELYTRAKALPIRDD